MACRHLPRTRRVYLEEGGYLCAFCGTTVTPEQQRKGRTVRLYGIGAELDAARKYGGRKTNDGGPVDIIGTDWATQMKTKRTLPPKLWAQAFAKMADNGKLKRLLIRYVQGPGKAPIDYYVIPAADFLAWYGKDE